MSSIAKILARIDTSNPDACWPWPGATNGAKGYPITRIEGRYAMVHRVVYEHFVGRIPKGLTLDHLCHTQDRACPGGACEHRRCVNPSHLEPVERGENARRGGNARKTRCPGGHEYSKDGYTIVTAKGPERRCRKCERTRDRRRRPHRYRKTAETGARA